MKKFFILLIACFFLISVQAAYLKNIPVTVTQPDGTELHCFASGDEYFNYLHDKDGYTIMQHPETGYYVYAEKRDGKLVATDIIAGRQNPTSKGLEPYALISPEEWMAKRKAWQEPEKQIQNRSGEPNHGTLNNIAIFIRFSDDEELTNSYTAIDNMFNDMSDGAVSMRSYFKAASYGNIDIPTTFYPGHNGNVVISYQDTYPRSYFNPYSSTNTNGYNGDDDRTEREHSLLQRAVNYVNTYYPIPTDLNIDYDNDGYVDNVCFIVKGSVGGWNDLLWPHKWALYTKSVYINSKRVWTFNFQLADATDYFNTSTMCHEMNHSLSAPDLYHYSYSGPDAVGSWDLMCSNATPPQHCGAYMKMKYGHWVDDIPEITQPGTYTLNPVSSDSPTNIAYKIASSDPNQFYVVEYRDKTSLFETALPGSGLLIYRIDSRFDGNASYDPDNEIYDEVYIFRPNGTTSVTGNLSRAHFSSNTGRTEFSATTNPYPFYSDGSRDEDFKIYDISAAGNTISFSYGGVSTLCDPPTNVTATVNNDLVYLSWDAADNAQSYNIYRNGTLLTNTSGTTYTDYNVVLGAYSYYLKSVDVNGQQSGASETVTVSIIPEGHVFIGDGGSTSDDYLPSYSYYNYSLTQQIYTSEELGYAGTINSIAFYNEGAEKTRTLDFYMMNTTKNSFSGTSDWVSVTASDKVFSGSVTMKAGEWNTITLDTPFNYDGTSNLILITDDNSGTWTQSPHMSCRVFTASNKALRIFSDDVNYNPSSPSSYTGTISSLKNQILIQKDDILPDYTVSLSANPAEGGTVSGSGTYQEGSLCTIYAEANEGYTFVSWTKNGLILSTEDKYSFNVTEDVTLVANFNINSYQITARPNPVEGGSVIISGSPISQLVYDFEDRTSQGWTILQGPDSDSPHNWMHCVNYTGYNLSSGYGHNASNGFMLSESMVNNSYGVHPDNYLVSPQVLLGGSINFWATNLDDEYGAEHFAVAVSTNGNTDVNDFTTVQEWTLPVVRTGETRNVFDDVWNEYTVDLSAYSGMGYIAIRHFDCYEQWVLCVDDITIIEYGGSVTDNYIYGTSCTVLATPNEGYEFVNWTENGDEVSTETSYTFTVTNDCVIVANFEAIPLATQTSELVTGLNWWTANVGTTLADLEAALGANGLKIMDGNGNYVTYNPVYGWGNNPNLVLVPGQMYKIQTSTACEIELTGEAINPSEVEITLHPGTNWIGFIGSAPVALSAALSNMTPTVGDVISGGGDMYARYTAYGWGGNLTYLVPGEGYIYNSKASTDVTFIYSVSKAFNGDTNGMDYEYRWTAPAPGLYADRNHVTAQVMIDGDMQTSVDIEVAAFIGDEVRGRVRLIDGYTYLTVFGNPEDVGQTVTFKAYDHATGAEYGICQLTVPFSGEEEMHYDGDAYMLRFSKDGNAGVEDIFAYQNGSDIVVNGEGTLRVYDVMGRFVGSYEINGVETIEALPMGVYIFRMTGETVKTQKIVVR